MLKLKKIAALLLCAVLILPMLPISVFAASGESAVSGYVDCDGQHTFGYPVDAEEDTLTCYYYDSYFTGEETGNATKYNPSLATMSYCLAMAGFATEGKEEWTSDVNAPNPRFKFARNMLIGKPDNPYDIGLGFTDFAVNDVWNAAPGKDTIGITAARKVLSNGKNLVAVSIRGSGYQSEWCSSFTIGSENEHTGFAKGKDDVLKFLDEYLHKLKLEKGTTKLWITGHSRGACVANLVAAAIDDGYEFPGIGRIKQEDLYAYTFESPMGAMEEQTNDDRYANIHNVVNYNDMITLIAPTAWNFDRYNSEEDVILPNQKRDAKDFEQKLSEMLLFYNSFKRRQKYPYNVKEKREVFTITDVNWDDKDKNDPIKVKYKSTNVSNRLVISNMIDLLAEDLIGSRENYHNDFEESVRTVLGNILNNDNEINEETIEKLFAGLTRYKICELLGLVLEEDENTDQKSKPAKSHDMKNRNRPSLDEDALEQKIEDYVNSILEEQDRLEEGAVDKGIVSGIVKLLYNTLKQAFYDLILGDGSQIATVIAFAEGMGDKSILLAHYPEVNLSWLMTQDPNYSESHDSKNLANLYGTMAMVLSVFALCFAGIYILRRKCN